MNHLLLFAVFLSCLGFLGSCRSVEDSHEVKQNISTATLQHHTQQGVDAFLARLTGKADQRGHVAIRQASNYDPNMRMAPSLHNTNPQLAYFFPGTETPEPCYVHAYSPQNALPRYSQEIRGDWVALYGASLVAPISAMPIPLGKYETRCLYLYDGIRPISYQVVLHFEDAKTEADLARMVAQIRSELVILIYSPLRRRFQEGSFQGLIKQMAQGGKLQGVSQVTAHPVQDITIDMQAFLPLEFTHRADFQTHPTHLGFYVGLKRQALTGETLVEPLSSFEVPILYQ